MNRLNLSAERIRSAGDYLLIAAFLTVLITPCCLMQPADASRCVEQTEFRRAALFPEVEYRGEGLFKRPTTKCVCQFPHQFEEWFSDHLRFRRAFIQLHSLAKVAGLVSSGGFGFPKGQLAGAPVLVGENGWLYFSGERMPEEFTGTAPFNEAELEEWALVIEARTAWLAERGSLYVLFFAPNQQTIYPENVPASIGRRGQSSRLDQLKARLEGMPNLEFVDLRDDLIRAKQQHPTYQKTDNHWNDFGAYVGYCTLMNRMQKYFPGVTPEPLDHFDIFIRMTPSSGNLARLLSSPIPIQEEEVKLVAKMPRQAKIPADKPDYGHVVVTAGAALPRAVIVHDSFYPYMTQFLEDHWQRLCSRWTLEFPAYCIEQEKPDVVFQEMVERKLMVEKPVNPPEVTAALTRRLARQNDDRTKAR